MHKILSIILALALLCAMGAALAVEPITIKITPLDYQTGKTVSKTSYVENELFSLRVDIEVPRFADTYDMEMLIEIDGVELDYCDVDLETGTYHITGVVTSQPAALTVKAKDMAYDNADTAEELYNALHYNRTVSATYRFYAAAPAIDSGDSIFIPKTGDASFIAPAMALVGVALAINAMPKRRK